MKKQIISYVLAALMLMTTGCASVRINIDEKPPKDKPDPVIYLGEELERSAEELFKNGEDIDDIYSELRWTSIEDSFPSKFDLRKRGTVTPVKNQSPWGTCWSFGTIAASETSILNSLGLTTESFKEKYGEDLDLSEKHLAWFATRALPELDEYPEGEYPFEASQAGEGFHFFDPENADPLNSGGNYFLSATSLSEGIGMLKEKYAPYTDSEGKLDKEGDWSLPDDMRYAVSYELKDANALPSPSGYDENGDYVYRSAATEAIKTELLAGRAVSISYKADEAMPDYSVEEMKAIVEEFLKDNDTLTDEEKEIYVKVRSHMKDSPDVSDDELRQAVILRLRLRDLPEDIYDTKNMDRDQLFKVFWSSNFGESLETIMETNRKYLIKTDDDQGIYAQYTYDHLHHNHVVTIVGYDDDFAAENWPKDQMPPGDGAWIVKNSWGEKWGNDGYFMLSYYDKTLCIPATFDYVVEDDHRKMESLYILGYDKMPAEIISSTLFDTPVYAANVYEMEEDCVLEFVSAMTGDLDTTVTASIYMLDDKSEGPTDGVLLDSVTETFRFAGYHRLELNDNLLIPDGTRIGIAVLESVPGENGIKYSLINTSSLNKKGVEEYNLIHENENRAIPRYAKGIVNRGESFVSFGSDGWTDWSDVITRIENMGSNQYMAYDNLPIKAYVYPLSEVEKVHDLSESIRTVGGKAAICPEDGYTLLDITGK